MANKLISASDHSLTEALGTLGLARFARGVYAQSNDDIIWRGICVAFNVRKELVIAQPYLSVFCPAAEKLVSDGLREHHDRQVGRSYWGRLHAPVLTRPLCNLVRSITGEDRVPSSYYMATVEQVEEVAKLIRDDFEHTGRRFLASIASMLELRDHLMTDSMPGARMYAISVTYLMNRQITRDEIDKVLGQQTNAMSREFSEYFKRRFADAPA